MATTYVITAITDCENCEGTGWIYNTAWDNPSLDNMTTTEIRQYIEDYGNEEISCAECKGAGVIRREVRLATALRVLGLTPDAGVLSRKDE